MGIVSSAWHQDCHFKFENWSCKSWEVKVPFLFKWSNRSSSRIVRLFEHILKSHCDMCVFKRLAIHHSNIGVRLTRVTIWGKIRVKYTLVGCKCTPWRFENTLENELNRFLFKNVLRNNISVKSFGAILSSPCLQQECLGVKLAAWLVHSAHHWSPKCREGLQTATLYWWLGRALCWKRTASPRWLQHPKHV